MEKTIFVVDDVDTDLFKAEEVLEKHYVVFTMTTAKKMFNLLKKITPHLILLDIEMPDMNGLEILSKLKSDKSLEYIPVIFLTSSRDVDTETKSYEKGVADFLHKPFSPTSLLNRVNLHINLGQMIREQTSLLKDAHRNIIHVLSTLVEYRDEYTGGHMERTAYYIRILVAEMMRRGIYINQLKDWDMDMIHVFALLHDIGKVGISDSLLNKPDIYTSEERLAMQKHSLVGESIINRVIEKVGDNVFLHNAKAFTTYHHECWDGSGYPYGLKGEEIPLQGRIMAIADVYDALTTERPYKDAYSPEEAVDMIMKESGIKYDPKIAEAFYAIRDRFETFNNSAKKVKGKNCGNQHEL
ncbi:MAG: response regulator [Defluviitaleaceae bacterium]|nr:response regulator [Defluviitaleaceae bacterium]